MSSRNIDLLFFISLGKYQDQTGQPTCALCPKGYYCDPASLPGGQGVIQPLNCTAGYYCPSNTSSMRQYPCLPGTYSNTIGLEAAIDCDPCDPRFFCAGHGNTTVSGPCAPGISNNRIRVKNQCIGDIFRLLCCDYLLFSPLMH